MFHCYMVTLLNINKEKKEKYTFDKPGKYIVFFKNLSGKFIFELKEKGIELEIYGLFISKAQNIFKI